MSGSDTTDDTAGPRSEAEQRSGHTTRSAGKKAAGQPVNLIDLDASGNMFRRDVSSPVQEGGLVFLRRDETKACRPEVAGKRMEHR